jgi:hypothetical protein
METYVEVRQTGLDALGGQQSLRLAADLLQVGARFTRVDGYYDDRARHAEPPAVAEAFRQRLTVTRIKRVREQRGWVLEDGADEARADGATTYIGSPTSEAMIRIYDKAAESGSAGAGVRWEVQMRRHRAEAFGTAAIATGDALGAYVLGCIRGLVDFRERAGVAHGERAPLAPWWAAIIGDAERVTLNAPVKPDSLERTARWLMRGVAPSLALAGRAYGTDWLNELLASGEERLTEAQLRLLGDRRDDDREA